MLKTTEDRRAEELELCEAYTSYVLSYREGYAEQVRPLLSLSAFIHFRIMRSSRLAVYGMFQDRPQLETWEMTAPFLGNMDYQRIRKLLRGYSAHIVGLDEYLNGSCPVCLDEYVSVDYQYTQLDKVCERLGRQFLDWMREYIFTHEPLTSNLLRLLAFISRTLQAFQESFQEPPDSLILDAAMKLTRESRVIPILLTWLGQHTAEMQKPENFDTTFDEFCSYIVKVAYKNEME